MGSTVTITAVKLYYDDGTLSVSRRQLLKTVIGVEVSYSVTTEKAEATPDSVVAALADNATLTKMSTELTKTYPAAFLQAPSLTSAGTLAPTTSPLPTPPPTVAPSTIAAAVLAAALGFIAAGASFAYVRHRMKTKAPDDWTARKDTTEKPAAGALRPVELESALVACAPVADPDPRAGAKLDPSLPPMSPTAPAAAAAGHVHTPNESSMGDQLSDLGTGSRLELGGGGAGGGGSNSASVGSVAFPRDGMVSPWEFDDEETSARSKRGVARGLFAAGKGGDNASQKAEEAFQSVLDALSSILGTQTDDNDYGGDGDGGEGGERGEGDDDDKSLALMSIDSQSSVYSLRSVHTMSQNTALRAGMQPLKFSSRAGLAPRRHQPSPKKASPGGEPPLKPHPLSSRAATTTTTQTVAMPSIPTADEGDEDSAGALPTATSRFPIRNKPTTDASIASRTTVEDANLDVAVKIKPMPHKGTARAPRGPTVVDDSPSPSPSALSMLPSSLSSRPAVADAAPTALIHPPIGALNAMSLPPQRAARHRVVAISAAANPPANSTVPPPDHSEDGSGGDVWSL